MVPQLPSTPEFGSTRRSVGRRPSGRHESGSGLAAPSRMSIIQRASLHWVLSVLSPVVITASILRCVTGLTALAISRTMASITCGPVPSCGRYAAVNGGPTLSRNSTRAGDSSSTSWKSVSCPKVSSGSPGSAAVRVPSSSRCS